MNTRRNLLRTCDGTTTLEFAFAAVALVLVVFGGAEMGRMVWTQQVLQAAATETARCLAIGSANCPDGGIFAATAAANRGLSGVQTSNVAISANDPCGAAAGTYTRVTINYAFTAVVPAYVPVPAGGLSASACFPH